VLGEPRDNFPFSLAISPRREAWRAISSQYETCPVLTLLQREPERLTYGAPFEAHNLRYLRSTELLVLRRERFL
jgi:hypothetical protein